jgi:hypothetical protein
MNHGYHPRSLARMAGATPTLPLASVIRAECLVSLLFIWNHLVLKLCIPCAQRLICYLCKVCG